MHIYQYFCLSKDGVTTPKILATYSGTDLQSMWRERSVYVPAQPRSYNIVIEGVIGTAYTSDAAIDDISLESGTC